MTRILQYTYTQHSIYVKIIVEAIGLGIHTCASDWNPLITPRYINALYKNNFFELHLSNEIDIRDSYSYAYMNEHGNLVFHLTKWQQAICNTWLSVHITEPCSKHKNINECYMHIKSDSIEKSQQIKKKEKLLQLQTEKNLTAQLLDQYNKDRQMNNDTLRLLQKEITRKFIEKCNFHTYMFCNDNNGRAVQVDSDPVRSYAEIFVDLR